MKTEDEVKYLVEQLDAIKEALQGGNAVFRVSQDGKRLEAIHSGLGSDFRTYGFPDEEHILAVYDAVQKGKEEL